MLLRVFSWSNKKTAELILGDEVYAIAGAATEIYYQLGAGFLEPVYQGASEIELARRRIPFEAQKPLDMFYKLMLRSDKLPTKCASNDWSKRIPACNERPLRARTSLVENSSFE